MRRRSKDAAFDRARHSAMAACAIWPIALVIVAPWLFENVVFGMVVLVASIAQFLWVPDAFASWITRDPPTM